MSLNEDEIPASSHWSGLPGEESTNDDKTSEPVWTFRGYRLRASEFTTAMVHFFRAEIQRANVWRVRLDTTTNWAVITTGASISLAFTREFSTHYVLAINALLVTMFLSIEARRYRYYELWSSRVRLMETDFFAAMLVPPFHPSSDWAEALAENLLHPQFPISIWEALGRRLRRNYFWIYIVLIASWFSQLYLKPYPAASLSEFIEHAAIGPVPGNWVLVAVLTFVITIIILGVATIGLREATGEVLPRYPGFTETRQVFDRSLPRPWFRSTRRRSQLLTLIITDEASRVSDRILKEMQRGVTAFEGTGMFTGKSHSMLLCALTITEIPQMKALVAGVDPSAFIVVSPAQEILGKGFIPLSEEDGHA
ncbi:MAG: hypothetical protein A2Z16_11960, partial [Chloroflexi bacterium RBG_16_54_18]